MKLPKPLDDALGTIVAYRYLGYVPSPTAELHLTTSQLRETGISEDNVRKIEAILEGPAESAYTLGYWPRIKSVGVSSTERKWTYVPTEYDRALADQEFIILLDRLQSSIAAGKAEDASQIYLDFSFTDGQMRRESVRVSLPWPLTQAQFADCIDSCIGTGSHSLIFAVRKVTATYHNLPKDFVAGMDVLGIQLSYYGLLSKLCQKMLKPEGA